MPKKLVKVAGRLEHVLNKVHLVVVGVERVRVDQLLVTRKSALRDASRGVPDQRLKTTRARWYAIAGFAATVAAEGGIGLARVLRPPTEICKLQV